MAMEYWHIRIAIDSSSKERIRELAQAERRSLSNYVSRIIEQKAKETGHERPA